jgi:AmmeMemoRadiSam system protein A
LIACVKGEELPRINLESLPGTLQKPGVSFVTLLKAGQLRGCVGGLDVRIALAIDVQEHTVAAAKHDYRFDPVREDELDQIKIEISRLTPKIPLTYQNPDELLRKIQPGIDGVVIIEGTKRATFLPTVWKKIPDTEEFLNRLCQKMGVAGDYWRSGNLEVYVYQTEEFHE